MKAHVTLFSNTKATHGTPSKGTWPDLINSCLGTRGDLSIHELWTPAKLTNDRREAKQVEQVYALVLDFDGKDKKFKGASSPKPPTVQQALAHWRYKGWWHHTRSHTEELPCFRVLIPLDEPISAQDHAELYQAAIERELKIAPTTSIDEKAKDPARLWYMPEGENLWYPIDGALLCEQEWRSWIPEVSQIKNKLFDPVSEPPSSIDDLSDNETRIAAYLAGMPASVQGENGSTACFNAARKVADFEVDDPLRIVELLELYYNPQCSPPWSRRELEHKAKDALKSRIKNPIATPTNVPIPKASPKGYQPESADKLFGQLIRSKKGQVTPGIHNYIYLIHSTFGAVIRFDEFLQKVRATGPLPWSPSGYPRDWRDVDSLRMCAWLERTHGLTGEEGKTHNAVTVVAEANSFDSYKDHMNELPKWDGKDRLTTWLTKYLGVFSTTYSRTVGRAFLIAMVARAMRPGSEVHNILVLEGSQGIGKSHAARIIAGEEQWFTSAIPDLQSKDAAIIIQGKAIVEVAELAAMRRSNNESSKEFITRNFDKFRPPYGRNEITSPRRCVFIATTNHTDYLTDETGGRRYWPVKCSDKTNLTLLGKERNQLLAEAKKAFENGEKWYGKQIDNKAFGEQQKRNQADPWDDDVDSYIDHPLIRKWPTPGKYDDFIGTSELMGLLGIDTDKRNTAISQRINRMMRARGWVPLRISIQKGGTRTTVRGFSLAKLASKVVELNAVQPPEEGMRGSEQGGKQMEFDVVEGAPETEESKIDDSSKSVIFNPGV